MSSKVDIANMAVGRCGIGIQIASLEPPDDSEQARQCAFWYDRCRRQMLRFAPWKFARRIIAAVPVADIIPGYQYVYQYPSDCVLAIAITSGYGYRSTLYWAAYFYPYLFQAFPVPKVPFEPMLSNDGERQVIATDMSQAYLMYIADVQQTELFDPLFESGLGWKLGAEIAGPLKVDMKKVAAMHQMANQAVLTALAQAMNEATQDPERDSDMVSVRWPA